MKKLMISLFLSAVFLSLSAQDRYDQYERPGFDGDNFSLEGALEVFKQSNSIRDFERKLNSRDSYVNNLDLDFDGRIDYVRVEHKRRGSYHAIILQVPVDRRNIQDIAVIELEKTGRRTAMLQIIGDDYIYGNQVVVEPIARGRDTYRNGVVNVYNWPAVRHILRRNYNPWISPYRYSYYPTWWSPWRQYAYYDFYPHTSFYRSRYHYTSTFRMWGVHDFYRPYRVYCPIFLTRSNNVHVINGTTRRDLNRVNQTDRRRNSVRKNRSTDVNRNNAPARSGAATKANTRRNTSPARTNSSTRVNKRNTTSPTRATTRTKAASPTRATTRTRATSPTRATTRTRTTSPTRATTPNRRSISSVQRSTTRVSKSRTSTAPTRSTAVKKRRN